MGIHRGEELFIQGARASAMVVFAGCRLSCSFCYTPEATQGTGQLMAPETFVTKLEALCKRANNLNLITPSHLMGRLSEPLEKLKKRISQKNSVPFPFIAKTGGADPQRITQELIKTCDIIVLDFKVVDEDLAQRVCLPRNYADQTLHQLLALSRDKPYQNFDPLTGGKPLMTQGVVLRHLLMPDQYTTDLTDSFALIDLLGAWNLDVPINFMTHFFDPQTRTIKKPNPIAFRKLLEKSSRHFTTTYVDGKPAEQYLK
jgi:putative pyruvate formate lyase activating enzyme